MQQEPRHNGPLKGHRIPILLQDSRTPVDGIERVIVLGDFAHDGHKSLRIVNPIKEVVVVEEGSPVAFDVVRPDRSLHEGIRQTICEIVQALDQVIELFVRCWVGGQQIVFSDFGHDHVADLPPADGRVQQQQSQKEMPDGHQINVQNNVDWIRFKIKLWRTQNQYDFLALFSIVPKNILVSYPKHNILKMQMNWIIAALAGVSIPALAYIGYNEGINSFLLNQQQREEVNLLFKKSDNSFHKRAVVPPIRRIVYPDFTVYYSTLLKIPLAVKETLTKKQQVPTTVFQQKYFREPLLKDVFAVEDTAYNNSEKYQLVSGQLASPEDKAHPEHAFTLANAIPQSKDNKLDTWNTFEAYQRELTKKCDSVDIISGPMFGHENDESPDSQWKIYDVSFNRLGKEGPAIPPKLYKIIRCKKGDQSFVSGFVFNNASSNDRQRLMGSFEVPIQTITSKTGLAFNIPGTSLTQFQPEIFAKTKEQFDKSIIQEPILKADNYKSVKNLFKQLKNHKIQEPDKVIAAVKKLGLQEIERLSKDSNIDGCEKVQEYLQMRLDLANSRLMKELSGPLKKAQDTAYKACANLEKLLKIKETVVKNKDLVPASDERVKQINAKLFGNRGKHTAL